MPSLTRNIYVWQEIAEWCHGPGAPVCHAAGTTITEALQARGMGRSESPMELSGLSDTQYEEILEAERRVVAERDERFRRILGHEPEHTR
jgi:hypothetical protein